MEGKLFGTSGIRMIAEKLTDEFARDLGKAIATYSSDKTIAVGRDTRKSGPRLEKALVSGIQSTGKDVVLLGIVPTPVVGVAAIDYGTGVMITASHNPGRYNGFKLWSRNGAYTPEQEKGVEDIFHSKQFTVSDPGTSRGEDYIERYTEKILENVGTVERKVRVFLDCANAAGLFVTPTLLERMGCEVVAINTDPEADFPHDLEPTAENLKDVCLLMKESGAEIGIVHDGDADRSAAIDRDGKVIDWDSFLSVLAYGKNKVVTTVDASMRIEEVCGRVIRTPVGDVSVANAIVRENADFGGEPSGSYIFPEVHLFPDGPLTAAKVVKMVSENRFYEILGKMSVYPTKRLKIPCEDGRKRGIMECLVSVPDLSALNVDQTDGIRITLDDGWVLIRPSGTEPYIRITAEARDEESLERIVGMGRKWLEAAMEAA